MTSTAATLRARLEVAHQRLYYMLTLALPAVFFLSNGTTKTSRTLCALLFLAGVFRWKGWFRMDRVTWPALLLAAVISGGYFWHAYSVPPDIFEGWHADKYIIAFGFFIILAYGTTAWKPIAPAALLVSAGIGLLLHLCINVPVEQWLAAWHGSRIDFGFRNAQHAGIMFATALLATAFLGPRAVLRASPRRRPWIALACTALFVFMLWGVLTTQVRAVWLGLICSLLATCAFALIHPRTRHALTQIRHKRLLLAGALALATAMTLVLQPIERIERRLAAEDISIERIAGAAQFKPGFMTSSGVRIATWTAAKDWILERPLMGWGARSVKQLIRQNPELDKALKGRFGHLHNSYLELTVAVGTIAVGLMMAIIIGLARMTAKHWRERKIPTDAVLFLFGFLVFWSIVNMFESYLNYRSGFLVQTLICTFAYAWCLHDRSTVVKQPALAEPFCTHD